MRHYVPILIHILGWGLLVFIFLLYQPLTTDVDWPVLFWVKQGLLCSLLIGAFYLNSEVLTPRLLLRDRTGLYMGTLAVVIMAILASIWAFESYFDLPGLIHRAFHPDETTPPPARSGKRFQFTLLSTLFILGISTSITAVRTWQRDAQLRQDLEQAKISSELLFLKTQINPHFFFNTLNNIYALTLIDVVKAREALHRLSRMMRYVLYENPNGSGQISQEIAFVQDYIELMQLRLTDKVTVRFTQPTPLRDASIPTMLLLPFVENAFKHGVSALLPSRIEIDITQPDHQLRMQVRNTVFPEKNPTASLEAGSGIGLNNTRRRLDLLYPNQYQLDTHLDADHQEYVVDLVLNV
ncbi:sensor histidine kinase [Rudanella lutea]|uniref:sensor histidine kinase n=1 Tax=Rudanella lutea TaxID=451374 RepID=UPI001FE1568E|nr:histidine kinase [Rudanella lutea]